MGSKIREGRNWKGEEKRRCRWKLESWEHMVDVCMGEDKEEGREEIIRILEDDGKEEAWMKRLQVRKKLRKKKREKEERRKTNGDERTVDGNISE